MLQLLSRTLKGHSIYYMQKTRPEFSRVNLLEPSRHVYRSKSYQNLLKLWAKAITKWKHRSTKNYTNHWKKSLIWQERTKAGIQEKVNQKWKKKNNKFDSNKIILPLSCKLKNKVRCSNLRQDPWMHFRKFKDKWEDIKAI